MHDLQEVKLSKLHAHWVSLDTEGHHGVAVCHAKFGPPKIGPARSILAENFTKIGPPGHFCCQNRAGSPLQNINLQQFNYR